MKNKFKVKKPVKNKVVKSLLVEEIPTPSARKISPEIENAASVAKYYGFNRLPWVEVDKQDILLAKKSHESLLKSVHPFKEDGDHFGGFLEEKIAILRNFTEKKFISLSSPVMGFYEAPLKGNPHMKKNNNEETFNLEIIGSGKSITEATLLETSFIILRERYPDHEFTLEINSIGDKESVNRFSRELSAFVKREYKNFSKPCRALVNKDIFEIFNCDHKNCIDVLENAPRSMSFLSESSSVHFTEVLEYLESLSIPYNINYCLLGSRSYCTETIFEIKGTKGSETKIFGIGERYSALAKKIWGKKDIPAIGIALLMHPHFVKNNNATKEKVKVGKYFFIQFGFDAKLKSLSLIEMLRQANVSVEQSLSKDKLSVQLAYAEKINIPYVLIMGQKEAMEGSIVVRNMETRSQETLPMKDLVHYMKKLK